MSRPYEFECSTSAEIHEALGASVFYALADMPWSFGASAGSGETVRVYVSELPDTVEIDLQVHTGDVITFSSSRRGATRLLVGAQVPEIVVESGSGPSYARLEISLSPRLVVRDTVGRPRR